MNSSDKTDKPKRLTAKQLSEESMAIFITGQIMGLMGQLNVDALERFYDSNRSDPEKGSDFRYRNQIAATITFHRTLFIKR